MADTFRFVAPSIRSGWIDRPRLQRLVDRRFDVDVLTMVAPAGYGKTAALAAALDRNADRSRGVDVWLQASAHDDDADVLGAALLTATGLAQPGPGFIGSAEKVADALLRLAPQPVCLVIDDLHVLDPDSDGMALLGELVERLPTNGHLLLSGRTQPRLRLARLRAQGHSEEIRAEDLAFDDDEVDRITPSTTADDATVRWPAMATLLGDGRAGDTVQFLLEEVAASFGEERLAMLAALSHVRAVDDDTARAVSKGEEDAASLLGQLPLVHRTADGSFQLHDLWREAFAIAQQGPATDAALVRIAEHRFEDQLYRDAAELFVAAGDADGVARAAVAFSLHPLMFVSVGELRQMAAITQAAIPDRPITAVLNATVAMTGDERLSAEAFVEAAATARAVDDEHVEAIALYNASNMLGVIEPCGYPAWLIDRAGELAAAGDPLGAALWSLLRSHAARADGDPDRAVALLREPLTSNTTLPRVQHAFAMSDLGRPEEVAIPVDVDEAAQAGRQYLAQAIWLRGDISPELALEVTRGMADGEDARQVAHVQISTNAVLTLVALAAGDLGEARRCADRAASWVGQTASRYVQTFIALADAATLLGEEGEDAATVRLERMLDIVPIDPWPFRSYLYALPLLYVLAPRTRERIDACRFGPALTASQRAGQAVVRLREHDDPAPALELPWHRPDLLRAHVAPPLLGELAAAAAAAGHGSVGEVLSQLPSPRENLQSATRLHHGATAAWAQGRVAQLPARPGYDVHVGTFGVFTLARGATAVTDEAWVRRERVRQLLAHLVLHRRITRRRAAEDLWPDLPVERALQNLRVNLSHLQRVLQPARDADDPPWFVRTDQEALELTAIGLDVDADRFERACREARTLDEQAKGTRAIDGYRLAASLFRGEYLADWPDAEWASAERIRLRTLATAAFCRLGELLLARGEPEEATTWATTALRHEPLLERGHRLFIRGLAGQGNRAASVMATRELLARLADEDLQPEPETNRLAEGLGVG